MTWHRLIILITSLVYTLAFGGYYFLSGNLEFLWYVLVLLIFIGIIGGTVKRTRFSPAMLWALSFWGFLHMMGGGILINGKVLYAFVIIPFSLSGDFSILRFDQVVHFYGFAMATVAMFYLLKPVVSENGTEGRTLLLAFLAGMGLGAGNEIVEFIAVLAFPDTNVGGYYNTMLDLVFNMMGALTAIALIYLRKRLPDSLKFEVREPLWLKGNVREDLQNI